MKKIILILLVCMFVMPIALGETAPFLQKKVVSTQTCLSNTTLQHNQTWLFNNGSLTSFSTNEVCPNGCNTFLNVCQDTPLITYIEILVLIVAIVVVIFKLING